MNPNAGAVPSIDDEHEAAGHRTVSVYGPGVSIRHGNGLTSRYAHFAPLAEGDNGTGIHVTTLGAPRHRADGPPVQKPSRRVFWSIATGLTVGLMAFVILAGWR